MRGTTVKMNIQKLRRAKYILANIDIIQFKPCKLITTNEITSGNDGPFRRSVDGLQTN
jgi:hypothetical protein